MGVATRTSFISDSLTLQHSIATTALQWEARSTGTDQTNTDYGKPRFVGVFAVCFRQADFAGCWTKDVLGLFSQ